MGSNIHRGRTQEKYSRYKTAHGFNEGLIEIRLTEEKYLPDKEVLGWGLKATKDAFRKVF